MPGSPEINLNGGVVSNKGFIRQFGTPGAKIIQGKYVSAWGGIQSAGQTIGQIVSPVSPLSSVVAQVEMLTFSSPVPPIRYRVAWSETRSSDPLGFPCCCKH